MVAWGRVGPAGCAKTKEAQAVVGGVCPKKCEQWPLGGEKAETRVVSVSKPWSKALRRKNLLASGGRPAQDRGEERRRLDPQGSIWEISDK